MSTATHASATSCVSTDALVLPGRGQEWRSPDRWILATLVGVVLSAAFLFQSWSYCDIPSWGNWLWHFGPLVGTLSLAACLPAADRVAATTLVRRIPYALVAVIAAAAEGAFGFMVWVGLDLRACGADWTGWTITLANFGWSVVLFGVLTYAYVYQRRATQRVAALRAMQREHAEISRQALESRLKAMQARVEPGFLFDTLSEVERRYEAGLSAGGRMLDGLIAYLRAALPRAGETTSSLGREIELLRAWLGIVGMRLDGRLSVAIDVPEGAVDARMPPMLLVPLVERLIGPLAEPSQAGRSVTIEASIEQGTLKLALASRSAKPAPDVGDIDQVRERLHSLYGANARLALHRDPGSGAQVLLEIPHERANGGHR